MGSATSDQRGLADRELEVVVVVHTLHELVEFVGGNVAHEPTQLADEMPVPTDEVEERLAVRLVHLLDEPPFA